MCTDMTIFILAMYNFLFFDNISPTDPKLPGPSNNLKFPDFSLTGKTSLIVPLSSTSGNPENNSVRCFLAAKH